MKTIQQVIDEAAKRGDEFFSAINDHLLKRRSVSMERRLIERAVKRVEDGVRK